ncbi:ribokinase [Oscillospiraceae bacterium MB08-C2-2]|nr:ribokinase [Oscillospiraceae bacterium MB08-C2-2]
MGHKAVVFGSYVVDLMSRAPHLPVPGETVRGSLFKMGPGGKGFNQGVAAHRAGADVTMITKVGKDAFGQMALDTMQNFGMSTEHILVHPTEPTGTALILVDEQTSQNSILVVAGSCGDITSDDIQKLTPVLAGCNFLLTQLETNLDAVEKAVEIAFQSGAKVILNTAPVQPVSAQLLSRVYLITPNEVEAQILTGIEIADEASAEKAAQCFFEQGVENVIITLGSRGAYVDTKDRRGILPVPKVKVLDTTGAGDAFNGGLLTALTEGKDIWEAAEFANRLAALSIQRMGTSVAMPTRAEIDAGTLL